MTWSRRRPAADVLEYVSRGDIKHSQFRFQGLPGRRRVGCLDFNYPMRTLLSVQLVDVAPVLDRRTRTPPQAHARSTARWNPWPPGCRATRTRSGPG